MRVRKRLQINVAFSALTALVVTLILLIGLYRIHRAFEELDIADQILNGLFQRNTLRNDYLLTSSERAKEQWFAVHAQTGNSFQTASEKFDGTEDKRVLDEMIRDHDATLKIFTALIENRERTRSGEVGTELSEATEDRLLTQLNIRMYEKVMNINALRNSAKQRVITEVKRIGGGIAVFIAVMAAMAALGSWITARAITHSISTLREGSSMIGQGNLGHRIEDKGNDEFADLSRAFNAMTEKLSMSYLELQNEIAERRRAEEALRNAHDELELRVRERTAELERRNLELQNFTFVAAHDLQEPLRKIQTFGDLIADRYGHAVGEAGLDYIRRMRGTAARMQQVLHSLVQYSRVTSEAKPFKRVDLNEIAGGVVSDLELKIREMGASVEIGDLPEVEADAGQMSQLFQNLLSNALKFRRQGERVNVRIYSDCSGFGGSGSGSCTIFVKDNGIGFDEKYLDKIFAPFQRLHTRDEYEGVGMGLAICSKIVERHYGTITALSTLGEGSTFIVTLPLPESFA